MKVVKKKQLAKRMIIIDNATKLMNEVGFENLTIRMICDAANISAGTFYHYFENKSDLVVELFSLVDEYFEENVVDYLNDEDELKNIVTFSKGFVEYIELCGVARSKLINSMFPIYDSGGHHDELGRIVFKELYIIIQRGQKNAQIITEYSAEQLVNMILVILRGYCFDWARRDGTYDLVEHTDDMMKLFVRAIEFRE